MADKDKESIADYFNKKTERQPVSAPDEKSVQEWRDEIANAMSTPTVVELPTQEDLDRSNITGLILWRNKISAAISKAPPQDKIRYRKALQQIADALYDKEQQQKAQNLKPVQLPSTPTVDSLRKAAEETVPTPGKTFKPAIEWFVNELKLIDERDDAEAFKQWKEQLKQAGYTLMQVRDALKESK